MKKRTNTQLIKEIKEMLDADQALRMLWDNTELTKPLSQWGKNKKKTAKNKANWGLIGYLVYFIDAAHNSRIYRIIQKYGYPSQRLIGAAGMRHFWLLIQHQDYDLELQEECLKHCDFKPKEKAFLTDRVRLSNGKKQIYGTQFKRNTKNNRIISKPIFDPKNVNKRRKKIGLRSLEADLAFMNKKFMKFN